MANFENQILVGGLVIALAVFVLYSGDENQAKVADDAPPDEPDDYDLPKLQRLIREWNRDMDEFVGQVQRFQKKWEVDRIGHAALLNWEGSEQYLELKLLRSEGAGLAQVYDTNLAEACKVTGENPPPRAFAPLSHYRGLLNQYNEVWARINREQNPTRQAAVLGAGVLARGLDHIANQVGEIPGDNVLNYAPTFNALNTSTKQSIYMSVDAVGVGAALNALPQADDDLTQPEALGPPGEFNGAAGQPTGDADAQNKSAAIADGQPTSVAAATGGAGGGVVARPRGSEELDLIPPVKPGFGPDRRGKEFKGRWPARGKQAAIGAPQQGLLTGGKPEKDNPFINDSRVTSSISRAKRAVAGGLRAADAAQLQIPVGTEESNAERDNPLMIDMTTEDDPEEPVIPEPDASGDQGAHSRAHIEPALVPADKKRKRPDGSPDGHEVSEATRQRLDDPSGTAPMMPKGSGNVQPLPKPKPLRRAADDFAVIPTTASEAEIDQMYQDAAEAIQDKAQDFSNLGRSHKDGGEPVKLWEPAGKEYSDKLDAIYTTMHNFKYLGGDSAGVTRSRALRRNPNASAESKKFVQDYNTLRVVFRDVWNKIMADESTFRVRSLTGTNAKLLKEWRTKWFERLFGFQMYFASSRTDPESKAPVPPNQLEKTSLTDRGKVVLDRAGRPRYFYDADQSRWDFKNLIYGSYN